MQTNYKDTRLSHAVSRLKRKINLRELHKTYVIVPAERTANITLVVRRKLYLEVIRLKFIVPTVSKLQT